MTPEIKRFGKQLREFINSDPIISILPEGDWGAGGCWILAEALKKYLGAPATLWAIVTLPEKRVQHVLVQDAGVYFDFLGAQTGQEALDNFLEVDPVAGSVGLVPLTKDLIQSAREDGIPCDPAYVKVLFARLKARFG